MTNSIDLCRYLDCVCGCKTDLWQRIEALLEAHPGLGEFVEGPPEGDALDPQEAMRLASVADEALGSRVRVAFRVGPLFSAACRLCADDFGASQKLSAARPSLPRH